MYRTNEMKMKIALMAMMVVGLTACSNSDDAVRALDGAGYTAVETHGWSAFACSRDDFFSTKFTATNPNGKRVSGAVCSGLFFKNAKITFQRRM